MALTYMQRRKSGIYEFRKRLPQALAGKPAPTHVRDAYPDLVNAKTGCFKREVVRSLRTTDRGTGRKADLKVAHATLEMFDSAQRLLAHGDRNGARDVRPSDLEDLEAEARAFWLKQDQDEREGVDDRRATQTREERTAMGPDLVPVHDGTPWGMMEDHFLVYGEQLAEDLAAYRKALARRDISIVEASLRSALRRRGVPINPLSEGYRDAGLAILRGTTEAHEAMARRQAGEDVPTPGRPIERGPKLSEAYTAWQAGGGAAGSKRPGRSALAEAEPSVRRFVELHGDLRLGEITKQHARVYRDALARLPKRLPAKLRALPLPKLLESDLSSFEGRDALTINKMLNMMAAIVSRAKREGQLDEVTGYVNPFDRDMKLAVDRRTKSTRKAFEAWELERLFGSPVFVQGARPKAGAGEAAFWFPLIGLLSGMRLEEIAGLRIEDLREDGEADCWVFDIHPHGGRGVKNASSIRRVPVHPVLLETGLLQYREGLLKGSAPKEQSLWPAMTSSAGRPLSASWSKWFGRYLRSDGGVMDPGKVFHSFRHTFKQMARDAGLPEEVHDALTGHVGGGVGRSYGGIGLKRLAAAVDAIQMPKAARIKA